MNFNDRLEQAERDRDRAELWIPITAALGLVGGFLLGLIAQRIFVIV